MRSHRVGVAIAWGTLVLIAARDAETRTLTDDLLRVSQPGYVVIAPVVFELQRTIARGTDFPAATTTPGYTYRYNPELNIFERSSGSLGPAFLERADTIGRHRFDLSFSYLYADFTQMDGHDLKDSFQSIVVAKQVPGQGLAADYQADAQEFDITSNVFYFSGTYGLTDRWDVNILIPLYYTSLNLRQTLAPTFGFGGSVVQPPVDDSKVGIGDIQLRTKYRFLDTDLVKVAAGLNLRIPSGNEENFQGIGDTTVTPSLVA